VFFYSQNTWFCNELRKIDSRIMEVLEERQDRKSFFNKFFDKIKAKSNNIDIDLMLYKYGILYQHDINHYLDDEKKRKRQKFKTWALSVWLVLNIIRIFLNLYYSKNGRIPKYFFDILQDVGGITVYYHTAALLATILSLRIVTIFNNNNKSYFDWFEIIRVLLGIKTIDDIRITDSNAFDSFARRIKVLNILINYSFKFLDWAMISVVVSVMISFYHFIDVIKYGIIASLIHWFWYHYISALIIYSLLSFYVVCDYCRIKFKLFNEKISKFQTNEFVRFSAVDKIVEEQNHICQTIFRYNKFWRKFYFALNYTFIPLSLLFLQMTLFESQLPAAYLISLIVMMVTSISFVTFNLMTATVHRKSIESYNLILKFYLKMDRVLNVRRKIKVLLCQK
jgi:hypothetical protein